MNPVVVIGGGLAGGAAATRLARLGRPVTLFEREAGPHEKVCGEFLSIEGCRDLESLGLAPEALGAVPIDRVRLLNRHHAIEAPLPFVARGISRARLDEALLGAAADAGAEVIQGVRVSGLQNGTVLTAQGECRADRVLLATGKHDLRALPRTAPSTREGYVGFKMHWRLGAAALQEIGSAVELHLFDQGYAGLQQAGANDANLCLVIKRQRFVALGGTWDALLAHLLAENPALARRIADAEALFAKPLAIANLPYGYVHRPKPGVDDDVWRLGDQAAMTASLTGDGMAGALRSARIAADCLTSGATAAQFHKVLVFQTGRQVRRAMLLQRWSERPLALRFGMAAARACPALLTLGARATRLPHYGGIR